VPKSHYFTDYDSKERWMSYWYQINEVIKTRPRRILEIGIGNRTVSDYLEKIGINVVTVDVEKSLNPDYVCSVIELGKYFGANTFDTILCAQVLEHQPFKYFRKSLKEMRRVTKAYVILSLPHSGITFKFSFRIFPLREKTLLTKIPSYKKHVFDGEHFWEIGKRGYPLKKIVGCISNFFNIERYFIVLENPYHMFFILRKRVN